MARVHHRLAISLEEHFQFAGDGIGVPRRRWDKFPIRLDRCVSTLLGQLDRHGVKATFVVGGWVAERHAAVLAEIAAAGHEFACRFDADEAAGDVKRRVEAATGRVVHGGQIALWAGADLTAERLGEMGIRYVFGPGAPDAVAAERAGIHLIDHHGAPTDGEQLRLISDRQVAPYLASWSGAETGKLFYFRLWELDAEVPRLTVLSRGERARAYTNLSGFAARLDRLLAATAFEPLRDGLGLVDEAATPEAATAFAAASVAAPESPSQPVSIVVPCFNEEAGLAYLANALRDVEAGFGRRHPLRFVLVDDGSSDGTWTEMQRLFAAEPSFKLVRHHRNRGIGAAILTGILAAETEIVAVMDSDCSYDPARIEEMVPLLEPGVDLVTASPYHALGGVEGVPEWRLFLSRSASWLYRRVLHNKLATYTSCFRVCRRSAVADLALRHEGYVGVVEMLARLDLAGRRIAEHPVVLESRLFGQSKIRIARVIAGHLRFISEILVTRLMLRLRGDAVVKMPR